MANTYTLWIVSPPDLIWSHVFDEVALALKSAFRELGYEVEIVTDPKQIQGTAIVFGANLCSMNKIALPADAVIYNLEQVHPDSRWFQKDYGYIELLKKHIVWDFSERNIENLKPFGIENVVHCAIGYAPELTRVRKHKEDVDVLFIGGGHPRRQKIMDGINAGGARVHQVYKVFGKERDEWMTRGKIHLNLHKEPAELFEIVRVSYLLSNKCFVVSENTADTKMMEQFRDALVFCPYDKLVQQCLHYLVRPKERKQIAEAGFEIFRSMPQKEYLAQALEGYRKLAARQPRMPSVKTALPKIFVAIASYRDPEIVPTINSIFSKAKHPERIVLGVCLQADEKEDPDCLVKTDRLPGQVRLKQYHYSDSKGANWARVEAFSMMEDEQYALLIDSHMRFVAGWDEAMIEMLGQCPAEKPVLSSYVPDYRPPNRLIDHEGYTLRTRLKRFGNPDDPRLLHISGRLVNNNDPRVKELYPTPFGVVNFVFAPSSTFKDVPIDPHIHFWGDEINFAARLWTHGYDIFQPNRTVLYHYWVRKEQFHQHDYRKYFTPENIRSLERIKHVLGFEKAKDALALVDIEKYGLGDERPLQGLWDFAGIDWNKRTTEVNSEEGIWNMAARDKSIGKNAPKKTKVSLSDNTVTVSEKKRRIFVQIASYRDPECQWTVKDLFEKAEHPQSITVGICWQFVKGEDDICFREPYPYPDQVRVHEEDARTGQGVCWARGLTQKLWQGEEFTFQIDSHMRFEQGWDQILLNQYDECVLEHGNKKSVLTSYPPGYTPPNELQKQFYFGMSAKQFDKNGIFLMIGAPAFEPGKTDPVKPIRGAFASANMLFGPSSLIHDVPYDPYLYFFGEEVTLAVRLWTNGYDLYHPNRLVIYHDWNRGKRRTHFEDCRDWGKLNERSFARVRHLLRTEASDRAEVLQDIEKYGLGRERTLEEYQTYAGVNFAHRNIQESALKGEFGAYITPHEESHKETAVVVPFVPPLRTVFNDGRRPKIFINIASYRDPECQWTVKDLFEKATYPDRINVGICWQFDPQEDKHCFEVQTRPEQVRVMPVNWREAEGVCWARHQTQQLWEDEEYTLMIDSHMRFVPGWDELMIQELDACESSKPLLSCSPTPYVPPNKLSNRMNPTIRRVRQFMPDGNIRCQGEMLDRASPKPLRGAFLVANFIFSRSNITPEVPYDPFLYFDQEEISYAARLYTHGWDVFSSRTQFLYHFYNDNKVPTGSVRPLHWRDLHKENEKRIHFLRDRGLKRFNHMTGHTASHDPEVTQQLDRYGFGNVRSFDEYQAFSGVDFKNKVATERALRCQFIPDLHLYRNQPIHVPELDGPANNNPPKQAAQAPVTPPPQTPQLPGIHHTFKMLEPGDFFPLVEMDDTNRKVRAIEMFAGKFTNIFYLPSDQPEFLKQFFDCIERELGAAGVRDAWNIFILDDTPEKLIELKQRLGTSVTMHADPGRAIARAFGIARAGEIVVPVGFALSPKLQIERRQINTNAQMLAHLFAKDCAEVINAYKNKNSTAGIVTETAPAIIVPNTFSPEFCAKLIHAFRNGRTFDGTVGAMETKAYRTDIKVRTDFILEGDLLAEVDEKLSRSFFPEIKKNFGFNVTHRELYKIGMYSGEKQGFFKQHRDNFDAPLGYRRIATTVHLNDEYEGGGLRFPEYGDTTYRPVAGSAIAFSCGTMHEAKPVTKGERFVLVGFFHGEEDEAYRLHFYGSKGQPLRIKDYQPTLRQYPDVRLSRGFYDKWAKENISYNKNEIGMQANTQAQQPGKVITPPSKPRGVMINLLGQHQAKKVFESKQAIIFDDFLPEDIYGAVNNFALTTDYERINAHGKSVRAWHIHDGFPLRTSKNAFYHAKDMEHPQRSEKNSYPTNLPFDRFIDHILAVQPHVEHMVGKQTETWEHFSVTGWMYPPGTGLAMHDDGSGVYSGAYVYFLNPTWRLHWGGLLLLADEEANEQVHKYRNSVDQYDYYQRKWLHQNPLDDMLMDQGFAQCVLPKRNRMVFIANDAYHMVTRVNEQCGDNYRMSLAGFFNRRKK